MTAVASASAASVESRNRFRNGIIWSLRRELLENRSVTFGPLGAATIFLAGFIARLIRNPASTQPSTPAVGDPYMYAALVIMATTAIVGVFYCLDALYAERRDRSVLFWKSLPVSDTVTVLSKAAIPLVVLPFLTIAITVALHLVMLLSGSIVLELQGLNAAQLWQAVAPVDFAGRLVYHVIGIHALWYAPFFAWLLLASAWSRRAPFVWAGLPILAVIVVEKLVVGSTRFLDLIRSRAVGDPGGLSGSRDMLGHMDPGSYFGNPGLWTGLALSVVFLAAAVRIRRRSGPL
jgi:ABC-2 type transport system permease protein